MKAIGSPTPDIYFRVTVVMVLAGLFVLREIGRQEGMTASRRPGVQLVAVADSLCFVPRLVWLQRALSLTVQMLIYLPS